ncbi:MAG: hypothetical protein ACKVQT_16850 [Burkholderiales bacterium]
MIAISWAQPFKSIAPTFPHYLALDTLVRASVIVSPAYRRDGGP